MTPDTPDPQNDNLHAAATALYLAGRWECAGVPNAAKLWEDLRDALGLPPGTATARGIGADAKWHCPACGQTLGKVGPTGGGAGPRCKDCGMYMKRGPNPEATHRADATLEAAAHLPHSEPHYWGGCVRCAARQQLKWADYFPPFVDGPHAARPDATAQALSEDERVELDRLLAHVMLPTFTEREREIARLAARAALKPQPSADATAQARQLAEQTARTIGYNLGWKDDDGAYSLVADYILSALTTATASQEAKLEQAQRELVAIDLVLARRPALDLPTRWQNIEKAISYAKRTDAAEAKLAAQEAELARLRDIEHRYHELLYQVASEYPGETRHETARRLIQRAEAGCDCTRGTASTK